MALTETETFNFAYELKGGGYNYKIVDDDPHKHDPLVGPAATSVTLTDSNPGILISGQSAKVTSVGFDFDGFDTGKYKFVATADIHGTTISGLIVEDVKTSKFYFLTDTEYTGDLKGNDGKLDNFDYETSLGSGGVGGGPPCFTAGTLIRTPNGEVAVESLKRGDRILTQDGRIATVDWLGIQTISMRFADKLRVLPIRIRAGAIAENVPSRDLRISPDHAILVEGALIQAGALVNGTSIVRETNVPKSFTYYHVEVEDHSLILAENTPAETFVDNVDRLGFDNWAEHEALYPNGKHVEELPYPRAKSHRQVPVSIRVMLAARALAIGAFESSAVA
jgi:hypothetical protein